MFFGPILSHLTSVNAALFTSRWFDVANLIVVAGTCMGLALRGASRVQMISAGLLLVGLSFVGVVHFAH